jgi:hypothetical protein
MSSQYEVRKDRQSCANYQKVQELHNRLRAEMHRIRIQIEANPEYLKQRHCTPFLPSTKDQDNSADQANSTG